MSRNRRDIRSSNKGNRILQTKNFMIASLIFIAIIVICLCIIMFKNHNTKIKLESERAMLEQKIVAIFEDNSYQDTNINNENEIIKQDTEAKISVVGDILCDNDMIEDAKFEASYNFNHMFENIKDIIDNSDLTIGTMETNFTNNEFSDYGKYNSPKEFAQAVKNSGIDLVSLAHNHALDYGVDGLTTTKDYLKELGYVTVGASKEERYTIKEINGIKIAFLAYTYGFNSNSNLKAEEKEHVNVYNEEDVKNDLQKAKEEAEYIFVMMHWGDVYSNNISKEQEKIAQFLVENGADSIVGAHPSVVEPMEVIQNSEGENVFIAYSVGNYISNLGYEDCNIEMVIDVEIRKDGETGKVTLEKVTYKPIYMLDNGAKAENRFELINMRETAKQYAFGDKIVSEKVYNKLIKGLEKIEEVIRSNIN